jgi:hypothetical protein
MLHPTKKKLMRNLILLFLIMIASNSLAQSFVFEYKTSDDEFINHVIEADDGHYYMAGGIGNYTMNNFEALLLKVDAQGNLIKEVRIPGPENNAGFSALINTDDGNFIVAGNIKLNGRDDSQIWLVKFNDQLDTLWSKIFGSDKDELIFKFKKSHFSNDLLIIGTTRELGVPLFIRSGAFFYRINQQGDIISEFLLDRDALTFTTDMLEFPDNSFNFFIFGSGFGILPNQITRFDSDFNSINITSTAEHDSNGNNYSAFDNATTVRWISDTNYIFSSNSKSKVLMTDPTEKDLGISIYNAFDERLKVKRFGKQGVFEQTAGFNGLDFINTAEIYTGGTSNIDELSYPYFSQFFISEYLLVKLNSEGEPFWEKYYSNNTYLTLHQVLATRDGGCVLNGVSYDKVKATENERDIYIIKVDSEGNAPTSIKEISKATTEIKVFPNPFTAAIHFEFKDYREGQIEIFDFSGAKVYNGKISGNTAIIDGVGFTKGFYLYRVSFANGEHISGKLIKN